jgi:hypothetical protein
MPGTDFEKSGEVFDGTDATNIDSPKRGSRW